MQAYVEGVSTRRVDDLVIAMGGTGISKSEVSRICAQLDTEVAIWRTRTLDHIAFPYVFGGRDVLQSPPERPGGVPGRGHRDRRQWRRQTGSAGLRDLRDRGLGGDAEVLRFHAGRESQAGIAERLLDGEAARDPQPEVGQRQCGRLYGVAQPLTAPKEVALRYITENSAKLYDLVQGAERYLPPEARDFEPAPHRMTNRQRRAHGVARRHALVASPS